MKKALLILAMCLAIPSGVFAQENGNKDENGKTVRHPYETNGFGSNWFITFQGGAGMYLGGYNDNFSERIKPVVNFNFGKWFTPSVGARISAEYVPEYTEFNLETTPEKLKYDLLGQQKFSYFSVHADFLWNMSNSIGGYKETRVYQIIPFFGAGYGQTFGGDIEGIACAFMVHAGIINKFRVSNRVDLNLEFIGSAAPQEFDTYSQARGKHSIDCPVNAMFGITIKLGKTNFKRVRKYAPVSQPAVDNEYDKFKGALAASEAENERLRGENADLNAKLAAVPAPKKPAGLTLYFKINKSTLEKSELDKLDGYMKCASSELGAEGRTIDIVGEADKATGTTKINQRLSEERAAYVKNLLVNKYHIDPKLINTKALGDTDNKNPVPELNRIATIVVE